jgi:divalent metal cation (Fe/Co/Zn/Cd) transporter
VEAVRNLVTTSEPRTSWVGIGLAAFTAPTMPLLALAKRRVGEGLGSSATVKEGAQSMLCAYLSVALLAGLLANALAGWRWADPATALVIAVIAAREGRESWRGKGLLRRVLAQAGGAPAGFARRRCRLAPRLGQ